MTTSNKDTGAAPVANGTDDVAGLTKAMEATTVQELGRKVFVGNLSFSTKVEQLREAFKTYGEISDVQIIHRGSRSLGYGFVTFSTCEEAEKAVSASDKSDIDGRSINVEIAKPAPGTPGGTVPRAAAKAAKASKATSARQTNGDAKSDEEHGNQTDPASPTSSKARSGNRRNGRGRNRRFGRPRRPAGESKPATNGEDHGATTDTSVHQEGDQPKKSQSKRPRTRRSRAGSQSSGATKRGSRPRKRGPPEGEPSKTLLFVTNLPFGVDDEKLKEVFSSYQVVSAHVIYRRRGSIAGRANKGFGFVEFENEENQLKALEEAQGKELDGRALHLKIAVNEAKKEEEEEVKQTDGASAPAAEGATA